MVFYQILKINARYIYTFTNKKYLGRNEKLNAMGKNVNMDKKRPINTIFVLR
jgi:hypothetical protein